MEPKDTKGQAVHSLLYKMVAEILPADVKIRIANGGNLKVLIDEVIFNAQV